MHTGIVFGTNVGLESFKEILISPSAYDHVLWEINIYLGTHRDVFTRYETVTGDVCAYKK